MISGLNQEVSVLGKTFHFQTELTRKRDLFVRTEVFVGGKVVATRENRLDRRGREKLDEEGLRGLMKEQHQRVIERTLERVKRYQEKKGEQPHAQPAASLPAFDGRQAANFVPPSEETREAASIAVRIRRIFGRFRLRLGLGAAVLPEELAGRLETAARGFSWIIKSPTFQDIRLDEQMRCHLVSDQVNAWLAGDREGARATQIWSEIVTFNDYVAAINNRAELIIFDRQLLAWAAFQVQNQGMSTTVLDQLQWLAGRDLELDELLDKPDGVAGEVWFAVLCQVLAQTPRLKPSESTEPRPQLAQSTGLKPRATEGKPPQGD